VKVRLTTGVSLGLGGGGGVKQVEFVTRRAKPILGWFKLCDLRRIFEFTQCAESFEC